MGKNRKETLLESGRVVNLPVKLLSPNPAQPRSRFDEAALQELADSIRRYGILQPLTVRRGDRGGDYVLVSGERRLRAARLAGLKSVPCMILAVGQETSSVLALVENLHRRDLDFLEEAAGLDRLIREYGYTQEETARQVGKSQSAVANKLRLLRLSPETRTRIREAGLTERHARALLRLEDESLRQKTLDAILADSLNVAQTEALVDRLLQPGEPETKPGPQPPVPMPTPREPVPTPPYPPPDPPKPREPVYIIKDVRLFLNSVNRGMTIMKRSGIQAEYGQQETDRDIILTIRIPKPSRA